MPVICVYLSQVVSDEQILPISNAEVTPGATLAQALLALNNAHAQELSWLEPERLQQLVGLAFVARRVGMADAFLLAFDQDALYDNLNFRWFGARYPRFVYIDRIVVASSARGRGLARLLYGDLFARRHARGIRALSARSTFARRIRNRMRSTRR